MSLINRIIVEYGADKLNSLTKYPSILTYHKLGEKGRLTELLTDDADFSSFDEVCITEKIDGTNARVIFDGEDYVIGSREELLFAKGDRFGNPQLNIVNTVRSTADKLKTDSGGLYVLYGEVYGGNVTAASKQYTSDKTYGFRIFDIAVIHNLEDVLERHIEKIASWRENGGQKFYSTDELKKFAGEYELETVPYISVVKGDAIPTDRAAVFEFLQSFSATKAGINANGKAEGIVVRSFDRSLIRKIRFDDYNRTLKQR